MKKTSNVIRGHEQTNRKNDKKFNGFLYSLVVVVFFYIAYAYICDSFFFEENFLMEVEKFAEEEKENIKNY